MLRLNLVIISNNMGALDFLKVAVPARVVRDRDGFCRCHASRTRYPARSLDRTFFLRGAKCSVNAGLGRSRMWIVALAKERTP